MSEKTVFEVLAEALIESLQDFLKKASTIRNAYVGMVKEGVVPPEVGTVELLERGGKLYARIVKRENQLIILPVESLQIKPDAKPIVNFLEPRILQNMNKKHGLKHRLEVENGVLRAIILEGNITEDIKKKLLNPIAWALEKSCS
jgi:hypothetical protein